MELSKAQTLQSPNFKTLSLGSLEIGSHCTSIILSMELADEVVQDRLHHDQTTGAPSTAFGREGGSWTCNWRRKREREWNSTQHNIRNHLVLDRQGQTRDWWIISRVGLSLLVQEECAASEHEKSITTRRSVVVDWSFSAFSSIKRWCRINLNSGHYKIVIRAMDLMRQQWTSIRVFITINHQYHH